MARIQRRFKPQGRRWWCRDLFGLQFSNKVELAGPIIPWPIVIAKAWDILQLSLGCVQERIQSRKNPVPIEVSVSRVEGMVDQKILKIADPGKLWVGPDPCGAGK